MLVNVLNQLPTYLQEEDRTSLSLTNKEHYSKIESIENNFYDQILKNIKEKRSIIFWQGDEAVGETSLGLIGCGGSKAAYQLTNHQVLMLPRGQCTKKNFYYWKKIAAEEVRMSEILVKWGFLTPLQKKVSISLTKESTFKFSTYAGMSLKI